MKITAVGMDLEKSVFVVHSVDERGKPVLTKQLKRDQVAPFFGKTRTPPDRHGGLWQRPPLGTPARADAFTHYLERHPG